MAHLKVIGTGVFGAEVEATKASIPSNTTILGVTGTLAKTLTIGGAGAFSVIDNPSIVGVTFFNLWADSITSTTASAINLKNNKIAAITISDVGGSDHCFQNVTTSNTFDLSGNCLTSVALGTLLAQLATYLDTVGAIFTLSGDDMPVPTEPQWLNALIAASNGGYLIFRGTNTITVSATGEDATTYADALDTYTWTYASKAFNGPNSFVLSYDVAEGKYKLTNGVITLLSDGAVFAGAEWYDGETLTTVGVSLDPLS